MEIGDKFIAEYFPSNDKCLFIREMEEYIGKVCEVVSIDREKVLVKFEDFSTIWHKDALKPIKGFYVGQKVYSHLFPTDDCSGVIKLIYNDRGVDDIQVYIGSSLFTFSKDGRYCLHGGVCLFSEPTERPKPKFEYGELVWVSDSGDIWTTAFFDKQEVGLYHVYIHKNNKGLFETSSVFSYIKKYE